MHGLNNTFLYAACRVIAVFDDDEKNTNSELGEHCINKDCVVEKKYGSGFFVTRGSKIFFITNRHMVAFIQSDNNFFLRQFVAENRYCRTSSTLPTEIGTYSFRDSDCFVFPDDPKIDLACYQLLPNNIETREKGTLAFYVPFDFLADDAFLQQLSICDSIALSGYPHKKEPVLKTGTIASDPRFDYIVDENTSGSIVAYDGFSSDGASGGPVFSFQKGIAVAPPLSGFYREAKCIGINVGHYQNTAFGVELHTGISFFLKSTEIIKLINNADLAIGLNK